MKMSHIRKIFTVEEANRVLPKIKELVEEGLTLYAQIERLYGEMKVISRQPLRHADILKLTRRRVSIDELELDLQAIAEKIHDYGAVIRSLHPILIDFPARINGDLVWLCWLYGEEKIQYYHDWNDGFRNRKKIPSTTNDLSKW